MGPEPAGTLQEGLLHPSRRGPEPGSTHRGTVQGREGDHTEGQEHT